MMDKKTQKIGVICSIVQIILSIICLIYSAINQENIIMWVLFLCSGILSLSSNIVLTTLIISKKPGNTGISRDIRTEFTTDLLLSD